jgi:hypothetical protein
MKIDKFTGRPDRNDYDYSEIVFRAATRSEKQSYFDKRHHEADRTEYDTPGSIRGCPCTECNAIRKRYGKRPMYRYLKTFVEFYFNERGEELGHIILYTR